LLKSVRQSGNNFLFEVERVKEILLSKPGNPSTYFQEEIEVEGYLSGFPVGHGAYEALIDGQKVPIDNLTTDIEGDKCRIRGVCKLPHLVPAEVKDLKNHQFQLGYDDGFFKTLSLPSNISFWPKKEWGKALGGINSPSSEIAYDREYVVIEGWAAKKGQKQLKVEVTLGKSHFTCPKINTWSPFVGGTLPTLPEAMQAGFSIALKRTQVVLEHDSESCLSGSRLLARVWFDDGTVLELKHGGLRWNSAVEKAPKLGFSQERDRALFIANNLRSTEGAPKVLFHIIRLAKEKNYQIKIITPKGGELENDLKELGVEISILPELYLAHYSRKESFSNQTRRGKELIDEFHPDLIFGNTIESFWALDHAKESNARLLWLIHESIKPEEAFDELEPELRVNFLEALDRCNKLIFVAEATAELYRSKDRETIVIPNGVKPFILVPEKRQALRENAKQKLKYNSSAPLMLNIGTICYRKGQEFFVEALKTIAHMEWEAVLVGGRQTDYLLELEKKIAHYGFSDRILIVPETREVEDYYLAADIVVISSREESAPLVSLEAMNYSLPLVSTEAFGLCEQLENSRAALMSPVDNLELFAAHLEKLLKNSQLRNRLGESGKAWVNKRYSLEQSLRSYAELLQE